MRAFLVASSVCMFGRSVESLLDSCVRLSMSSISLNLMFRFSICQGFKWCFVACCVIL